MFKPFVSVVSFVVISAPLLARAQTTDIIGVRAQGMAGAFTAVADDSTATWWNPAGLAGGAFINGILEYTHAPGSDDTVKGLSVAFPALGISYYRLPLNQMRAVTATGTTATATTAASREDQG